jgi:hypothetical protein
MQCLLLLFLVLGANRAPQSGSEPVVDPTAMSLGAERTQQSESPAGLTLHGSGFLSFRTGAADMETGINLVLTQLEVRYVQGPFGLYATPRVKIQPVGTAHDRGDVFFQQAYGYYRHPYGDIKLGKIHQRFGRLWDFGTYGPLLAAYDVTLQPDLGLAFEGAPPLAEHWNLDYSAQFFPVDGRSAAVRNSRFFAAQNIRRKNIVVAHVAPNYRFDTQATASAGLSGSTFEVQGAQPTRVTRAALDVDYIYGPINAFFEVGHQQGTDLVLPTHDLNPSNTFVWTGVQYAQPRFNLRYHFSLTHFAAPVGRTEVLHQPGAEYVVNPNLSMIVEGAIWTTSDFSDVNRAGYKERSVYLVANGKF